jgi:hypothetical protein
VQCAIEWKRKHLSTAHIDSDLWGVDEISSGVPDAHSDVEAVGRNGRARPQHFNSVGQR